VSLASLDLLRVGWWEGGGCWSFPERDSSGKIVGINRRFPNGDKKRIRNGNAGLTFSPAIWSAGDGPVCLVEGGSDTAALLTMGLAVVGRPSNLGGTDQLEELLFDLPASRQIIVIAEDDRLKNGQPRTLPESHQTDCAGCGQCWPGLFGAKQTADNLATQLGRQIHWALPPDNAKDARAWLKSQTDRENLGPRFLAGLVLHPVDPPAEFIPPAGYNQPHANLDQYRDQLTRSRVESVSKPGVYLDRSQTGAGKSYADREMFKAGLHQGKAGLVILPTHVNCDEVVSDLVEAGLDACKYPERDRYGEKTTEGLDKTKLGISNCGMREADQAEEMGLSIVSAACFACSLEKQCKKSGYLAGVIRANDSGIAVATHERAARGGLRELMSKAPLQNDEEPGRRDIAAIHENAIGLLRPMATIDEGDLVQARMVIEKLLSDPKSLDRLEEPTYDYFMRLADVIDDLLGHVQTAKVTTKINLAGRALIKPGGLDRKIFLAVKRYKAGKMSGNTWRVLFGAVEWACDLAVAVDLHHGKGGERVEVRRILASFTNRIPEETTVWLSDATADKDRLKELVGREVINATPHGHLPLIKKAVQIPVDLTRYLGTKQEDARVLKLLRDVLLNRPWIGEAGVIVHKTHYDLVEKFRRTDGEFGIRIKRVTYFGAGDERSDNTWYRTCDAIIVLGTPRPGGDAVRNHLVRCGDFDAASIPEPVWEEFTWATLNESGERVIAGNAKGGKARRYADPRWDRAHRELCAAELVQCVGRGRGILADGIEVVVCSTEPIGLPISDLAAGELNHAAGLVLACLRSLREEGAQATKSYKDQYRGLSHKSSVVADRTGLNLREVQRALNLLESRGTVARHGQRGGWSLVEVVKPADKPPETAVIAVPEPVCGTSTRQDALQSIPACRDGESISQPARASSGPPGGAGIISTA
jgi:hypothetical protein